MVNIYTAFEAVLKAALPQDCKIFQANMPQQNMDSLARESAKICTYIIYKDRARLNTSGRTPVHEIAVEVSIFGTLAEADKMSNDLTDMLVSQVVESNGWNFDLVHAPTGKRDIWDQRIQGKREYLQFQGFAIEPETVEPEPEDVTGTAGQS